MIKEILIDEGLLSYYTLGKYHKLRNLILINPNKLELHYSPDSNAKYCYKCQRVYRFKNYNNCTKKLCGELDKVDWKDDYYYLLFNSDIPMESAIRPSEHNASLSVEERTKIENQFNERILNTLVT